MHISKIGSYLNPNIYFCRRLTLGEEKEYQEKALQPAFDYLETKEVAMILHGTSYPKDENDIGVGTPYGKVAAQLIPFEILHGFNSNQLGPVGELSSITQISPYQSSVGSKNYLFIDFNMLAEPEYGSLLDSEDVEKITGKTKITGKNYSYSHFPDAFANYEFLMKKAYRNFVKIENSNRFNRTPEQEQLIEEKEDFYQKKGDDLNKAALFHVLAKHYGTDDFTKWSQTDKNICLNPDDKKTQNRLEYLSELYGKDIQVYKFAQFILDKQIRENTKLRQDLDFKYISDMLVGFSPADEWAHQNLFLQNYRMGCPYGGPGGGIQRWNVPVLNPKKLFNPDGSLGPAGKYLEYKLDDALTNFDNVRIDHALGLVDPFIYSTDGNRQGNISSMPDIDPDKNFEKVLNKIILPTLKKHGLDKDSPVWEDLVTDTPVFNRIYHYENNLPGITQLEYKKAEGMEHSQNWTLIGSHDSDPAQLMIKKDWVRHNDAWNPMYLAGVLNAAHDSSEYCKKIDKDDSERVKAKFAEMFMMGKKIQISFADFFGIDKTYNEGGNDTNPNNWKLRLNRDFSDTYYKNLSSDHPTAMNMPEILKLAVQGKAEMKIARGEEPASVWENVDKTLYMLDKYANILKEKE